jgi:hypothetical protein
VGGRTRHSRRWWCGASERDKTECACEGNTQPNQPSHLPLLGSARRVRHDQDPNQREHGSPGVIFQFGHGLVVCSTDRPLRPQEPPRTAFVFTRVRAAWRRDPRANAPVLDRNKKSPARARRSSRGRSKRLGRRRARDASLVPRPLVALLRFLLLLRRRRGFPCCLLRTAASARQPSTAPARRPTPLRSPRIGSGSGKPVLPARHGSTAEFKLEHT